MRVATYNIYLGADLAVLFGVSDLDQLARAIGVVRGELERTSFEERAHAIAALLAREQPDLVGLQEVTRWTVSGQQPDGTPAPEQVRVDFLPTLVDALAAVGCAYDVHAVNENFSGAIPVPGGELLGLLGANVTLVRRGVEVVDEAQGSFTEALDLVTGIEGVAFPIGRSWGRVDVRVDGKPLRFVNTHLEAWDSAVRGAQRDELLARNGDVEGPVVVVGDFNATPEQVGMPADWLDAWTAGAGDGFTCGQAGDLGNETSTLHERIDYVWVRGATVGSCRVIGDDPADRTPSGLWPSDHAGVVADVETG